MLEDEEEPGVTMNTAHVWQELLQILTEEVGSRTVETWFKAITFSQWDSATKTVYVTAPNTFVRDWVASQYTELLKTHLSRLINEKVSLLFLDGSANKEHVIQKPTVFKAVTKPLRKQTTALQTRYEFESFITGDHNAVAVAAAQAVSEQPGTLYNPFFICAGSGMGKTHLLQAIGNRIKKAQPKARIVYQSGDRFVHEFVNAIRFDKIKNFEARYNDADVLLIDDIQLLSHKEQTQEAFFHIFNALYEKGKQIIISSDTLPDDIEGISARLRSRLNGSLIADIQPPSLTTKVAILQKKALQQKAPIKEEVARVIASRGSSNVRELEGLLIRVLAFAALTSQALSVDLAHKVLSRTQIESKRQAPLDLPKVAEVVVKQFKVNVTDLRSSKRQKNLVLARHTAMYCMKKYTDYSLRDIATYWCRKDHSTVIHAVAKVELLREDEGYNRMLQEIERALGR